VKIPFKVKFRLPLLLGNELIRMRIRCLCELVKNAHDADATTAW
jgi:hypothetical protein